MASLLGIGLALEAAAIAAPEGSAERTQWFHDARYGVFVHFLEDLQNNPDTVNSLGMRTSWEECLDGFDVEGFADSMEATGAGYVIFTMMQRTRFLIAPNETFDRLTGYAPGEACSTRDLVAELADALERRGIPLMLYWTGDGPRQDPQAAAGMKCPPDGIVTEEFVRNWASVGREYAERYGTRVRGWWVDGSYSFIGYDEAKLGIMAEALRAGNPDAIVALNSGVDPRVLAYSEHDDYTSGEQNDFRDLPDERYLGGAQWHLLSFLGNWWGGAGTRLGKQELADYVWAANQAGGVVSIDVLLYRDGGLDRSQLEVLRGLRERLAARDGDLTAWREGRAVPPTNRAWRKHARLLSLDGSRTLIPSSGEVHAASKGLDGDPNTAAQGANEWAWTYEVDLLEASALDRVVVRFGATCWATEFEVALSLDRQTWQVVGGRTEHDGSPVELSFDAQEARYIRVRGLAPNAEGQSGGQMSIAELEAYGQG